MMKPPVDGELKIHGVMYRYEGVDWFFTLYATSQVDAERRLRAAFTNGAIDDGCEVGRAPVPYVKAKAWLLNLIWGKSK